MLCGSCTLKSWAAEAGEYQLFGDPDADAVEAGIDHAIDRLADDVGERELTAAEEARLAALQDALALRRGRKVPRRKELEPTFRELVDEFMDGWRANAALKETNTEQQKLATYDLFTMYWGDRPLREVRKADAAAFVDTLRRLDPLWAKSPKWREKVPTWQKLLRVYGGKPRGLSDATVNRHMAALQSLWTWGQERDHCEGNNPFGGFRRQLKGGRNVQGYLAWEPDELRQLFDPPPKRDDVAEVMVVAMFTGMRLDEIASLTRGQIKRRRGDLRQRRRREDGSGRPARPAAPSTQLVGSPG